MNNFYMVIRNSVLFFTVCLFVSAGTAIGKDVEHPQEQAPLIDVQLRGVPLKEAAANISRQTGYRIVIEKEWAELPVSGIYRGVSVENFFQRALKGKNISIISSDNDKIIIVRLFGNKKMDNMFSISANSTEGGGLDIVQVDPMDGQELSEIRELQAQYEAEQERWKNDPDAADPMDGQPIAEIKTLQAQYEAEQERWKNDPDAVDPIDGQPVAEIKTLQAQYEAEQERWKNDSGAVDPIDGQPIAEIKTLQAQYEAEQERWKNDPDAVDPMDGQSMAEIRQLQAQYNSRNQQ